MEIIDHVFTYTREEAIEDGVLIDVSDAAHLEGFRVPMAFTSGFYADTISAPCRGDNTPEVERLHEVLSDLWQTIKEQCRKGPIEGPYIPYSCLTLDGEGVMYELRGKVHSGPGGDGEHVITVMLADED